MKNVTINVSNWKKTLSYVKTISYINTFRTDVQNRFFNLLDQNTILKETIERVKKENIIHNVELTQYKLLDLNKDLNDASIKEI